MEFTDQLNRTIYLEGIPQRIISLVPSQTEFLFDLGLKEEIVGITKFCIHPEDRFRSTEKIGGTKMLNIEKIRLLKPDLIIGNKEENERSQVEELMSEFNVWMSDIYTLEDAFQMMSQVGDLVGKTGEASHIVQDIRSEFRSCDLSFPGGNNRIAYFIWKGPYMLAGANTFIDHLLQMTGFRNISTELVSDSRYPEISPQQLQTLAPDYIFLSSEPYPFAEKHLEEFRKLCPSAKIKIVDGELFSWYGSRLRHSPRYFSSLMASL